MKVYKNILKDNIIFWSRLGFGYDPPILNNKGHASIFDEKLTELKYHKMFYGKGVKIHSFIVNSGWIGVDKYDYTVTDKVMDAASSIGDDVLLIPRVKLNVPIDWCKKYPEELFAYYGGPDNIDDIKNMVGTLKQDYLGYEAPNGYYMGDPKYNRANVGGMIARQSFSSDIWLSDAKKALRKFVQHIEEKYPGKILGYHIAFGTSGETILWGRDSHRYGDYGISHTKKFKAYLKEKLNIEAEIPNVSERYGNNSTLRDFLRTGNEISVYYDEFTSKTNAYAIEELCKTVKEVSPHSFTGVFYAYLMVHNIVYTGHTELEKLLNSPYIDFFAAPKSYYRCAPGDSGGEISLPQSVNLKKDWVDECDIRTHLSKSDIDSSWLSGGFKQTKNVLIRELSKNLSHNSGFWLMDLGGGWYDDEEMMSLVGEINEINKLIRKKEYKSESDVLVLIDEKSILRAGISRTCFRAYCKDFICNSKKAGVLLDVYRKSDIRRINLSQYKAIVFAYTYEICDEELNYIKEKNSSASFIFNYAAGCIKNGEFSLDNIYKTTAFKVFDKGVLNESEYDFPLLCLEDEEDIVFKSKYGTAAKKTVNGRLHIFNTVPYADVNTIRAFYKLSGCHIYTPENLVIYGDKRFITVLSDGKAYDDFIYLKENKKWKNVLNGENGLGNKIKINLKPFECAMFVFM